MRQGSLALCYRRKVSPVAPGRPDIGAQRVLLLNDRMRHDLRGSTKNQADDVNLNIATEGSAVAATGVVAGDLLVDFAQTVWAEDEPGAASARSRVIAELGDHGLCDAAAVGAVFNGIDRVADATGNPLNTKMDERSADLRAKVGPDASASAA